MRTSKTVNAAKRAIRDPRLEVVLEDTRFEGRLLLASDEELGVGVDPSASDTEKPARVEVPASARPNESAFELHDDRKSRTHLAWWMVNRQMPLLVSGTASSVPSAQIEKGEEVSGFLLGVHKRLNVPESFLGVRTG